MGEPEPKQHVLDSIERCREALSTVGSVEDAAIDGHKKSIEEAIEVLESLKEKVFLKTNKALTPAYLVRESSQSIADLAEELAGGDDSIRDEFGEAAEHLKENIAKLQGAAKQHSVIVT
jgi:hypothetical protein